MLSNNNQLKESGHFYKPDGSPAYTYINKKGEIKNSTLREAKKYGWFPSVTVIMNMAAKPLLQIWMQEQSILSAITLPRIEGENDFDLMKRIIADSKEQAKKARDKGEIIHAWVQSYFEAEPVPNDALTYCHNAQAELETLKGNINWRCEMSFARDGYGGKCDLHTEDYIIDIKTTDKPLADLKTWDEHAQQLAAYRHGLGYHKAQCGILFINTLDAGARLVMVEEKDLERGLAMFMCLKDYFYAKTGL